jgi:hypothetical protein
MIAPTTKAAAAIIQSRGCMFLKKSIFTLLPVGRVLVT